MQLEIDIMMLLNLFLKNGGNLKITHNPKEDIKYIETRDFIDSIFSHKPKE